MTTKQLVIYTSVLLIALLAIGFGFIVLKVLGNLLLMLVGMLLVIAAWFLTGGQKKYPIKLLNRG